MNYKKIFSFFLGMFVAFILIKTMIYRFRHPDMSETQLFLHFFDAFRE
jgi:hypothetical protein